MLHHHMRDGVELCRQNNYLGFEQVRFLGCNMVRGGIPIVARLRGPKVIKFQYKIGTTLRNYHIPLFPV